MELQRQRLGVPRLTPIGLRPGEALSEKTKHSDEGPKLYIGFFLPIADLRSLRIFRLLRLLKLVRYSPALATLWQVLVQERRALLAVLVKSGRKAVD
jgi:Ion transport protein